MKAKITNVKFINEFETKFGILYSFIVEYDNKKAYYNSKSKEQSKFVVGQEADFTEEEKEGKKGKYLQIKPFQATSFNSNYSRAVKKEQSKYSGFAMSYAKDLVIAGKIELAQIQEYTKKMFRLMVELDHTLES